MNATVLPFPASRSKSSRPNVIEVQFDLGSWSIAYFRDRHFKSRLSFQSRAAAEAEAERLEATGMTWRRHINGSIYIMPDIADGGCWAVAHSSRFGDSEAILTRHFSHSAAVVDAFRFAREMDAEFIIQDDQGGAA